jgi:hypothetical protein
MLQQPAYKVARFAYFPLTTILLGVLRVNVLLLHMLLLVMLDSRWWCRGAGSHARHMSLGHAVVSSVVEVLVRGDRWSQNTGGDLLHIASLLRGLRAHEVRVDRRWDLLNVDLRCGHLLSSLLSQKCLPLEELLDRGSD